MKYSKIVFLFTLLISQIGNAATVEKTLKSPNKQITLTIRLSDQIDFSIESSGEKILNRGTVSLELQNEILGRKPKLLRFENNFQNEILHPIVPLKNAAVLNKYNALLLYFENDYQLEFRVFDNGVSYRFITAKKHDITVLNENSHYEFSDNYKAYLSKTEEDFSNYEHVFQPVWIQDFKEDLAVLPLYLEAKKSKILISEADLYDYPAMLLRGDNENSMTAWFPKYPAKTEKSNNSRRLEISKKAEYIAKTDGNRSFPWRIFAISKEDKDIATNELVYLLSRPSQYSDFSWIKPGQTSWEWWHASNIRGVDFKSGVNTNTYKYYIDFASKYNIKYIIMDEGWSYSDTDLTRSNPDIDLPVLFSYAKEKNVGIILWASWLAVENTPSFFEEAKKMGAAGLKVDFMDRSDQWMMNFYERTAKKAFENKLLVDFHGSISPKGLNRAYPNVISYEGVTGMEQNKKHGTDTPNSHVILPFTRNVVGPMDYTPGAMKSVQPKYWHANWTNPMSIGTRAHQLALYVVFESGLQMLADSPSDYYNEQECTKFITGIPTTWDQTVVLAGKIGEYIITAKRKGDIWYIGGITNEKSRDLEISFSFLEKDSKYLTEIFKDGINAESNALDYKKVITSVDAGAKLLINMSSNGGFSAKLTPN